MVLKKRRDHISTDSPSRMKAPKWWRVVRRVFFYGIILPVFVCCLGILFLGNKMIFVGCWEQELK